jgi:hypothetical protein
MSTPAEEIWAILREVAQSQKETDRKFQETDRKFQEMERGFKETKLLFQESDRKLTAALDKVSKDIGKLGNRLGDFVEEAVRPSAVRLFRERGIEVHEVHGNVKAKRNGDDIEIDLLVVNDTDVVAVECKSNLDQDDVDWFLKQLGKLKKLLPTYADKRVMGAVAAMVIPDNVGLYAYRKGLYVIGQNGDHLEIRNDGKFKPAVW